MANRAFTALIKSKGYNKQRLAEEMGIAPAMLSYRVTGRSPWKWKEVGKVCEILDITFDEFAAYFPNGAVKPSGNRKKPAKPVSEEDVDAVLSVLRKLLI